MAKPGLTIDVRALARVDKRIAGLARDIDRVVARARGTVVRRLLTEARRDIGREYNLKASRIAKDLRVRPWREGVELIGKRRAVGLIEFGGRWNRRNDGATAQIKRGGPRVTYGGTFIATGLRGATYLGNTHIFERDGLKPKRVMRKGNYAGKLRQPIRARYGPRIGDMLADEARRDRLADFAQGIASNEIDRLMKVRRT